LEEEYLMCLMVYIAADNPLPLIHQQSNGCFHVTELREDEVGVRRQFTKQHIRYVGSYEGCGCGFRYGIWPISDDSPWAEDNRADEAAGRESVERLSQYLFSAVKEGDVELYACWDGSQTDDPASRSTVTPAAIGEPSFEFQDRQFLTIKRAIPG
jgi:hypothetical protein